MSFGPKIPIKVSVNTKEVYYVLIPKSKNDDELHYIRLAELSNIFP